MTTATLIVPPAYEAEFASIAGAAAVKITARKVHVLDSMGKSIASCYYGPLHEVATKSFLGLVDFVKARRAL